MLALIVIGWYSFINTGQIPNRSSIVLLLASVCLLKIIFNLNVPVQLYCHMPSEVLSNAFCNIVMCVPSFICHVCHYNIVMCFSVILPRVLLQYFQMPLKTIVKFPLETCQLFYCKFVNSFSVILSGVPLQYHQMPVSQPIDPSNMHCWLNRSSFSFMTKNTNWVNWSEVSWTKWTYSDKCGQLKITNTYMQCVLIRLHLLNTHSIVCNCFVNVINCPDPVCLNCALLHNVTMELSNLVTKLAAMISLVNDMFDCMMHLGCNKYCFLLSDAFLFI